MSFEKAHPPTSYCYSSVRRMPAIDPTPVMAMATHAVPYAIAVQIFTDANVDKDAIAVNADVQIAGVDLSLKLVNVSISFPGLVKLTLEGLRDAKLRIPELEEHVRIRFSVGLPIRISIRLCFPIPVRLPISITITITIAVGFTIRLRLPIPVAVAVPIAIQIGLEVRFILKLEAFLLA
ncbi:hypothetical protein B0H13DRAFT_2365459 [Mycena leptocephala]|nr:hypothetical protein B0H13DRAFT_2365459 [Mycena leptocephala]